MSIHFDRPPLIYWSDESKISFLQRHILIHSIIYYELNNNCISDKKFDELAKQLVDVQKQYPKNVLEKTMYYYVLKDFTGETGFDLYAKLTKKDKKTLRGIAITVLRQYKSSLLQQRGER